MLSFISSRLPQPVLDLLRRCEADTALFYSLMGTIVSAASSPLLLFLVATRLTLTEQGFFYTFNSLSGLLIFVELGVSQIVAISVAHLSSKVRLAGTEISGSPQHIGELSAILRFYTGWYLVVAVLAFVVLTIAGFFVLSHHNGQGNVHWLFPWLLFVAGTVLGLPFYPFSFVLYGLGFVTQINFWRLLGGILRLLLLIGTLLAGYGLFAQGIATTGVTLLACIYPLTFIPLWRTLFRQKQVQIRSVARSALGFQWRVATSWLSGYAAQFALTPMLFALIGAQAAGQFGATYSLANAAATVSLAWVGTRTPRLGALISAKDWRGFQSLSRRLLLVTSAVGGACVGILFALYGVAFFFHLPLLHRFLGFTDLFLLGGSCWCYVEFGIMASLLRCFRSEPLIYECAFGALLTLLLPFVLIPHLGTRGAVIGHLLGSGVTFVLAAVHFRIFVSKWRTACQASEAAESLLVEEAPAPQ